MPRRLVLLLILAALGGGAAVTAAHGNQPDPLATKPFLESPAHFVLPPPVRHPTLAERAVKLARSQLGVPYSYGGASPGGFDCSGLVMWVYGRLGISLPHNAAALYGTGRPVSPAHLLPGDLVFFHGLGHVGLYVGRGRMIHAPQSGEQVEVQALGERSGQLVGARRIVVRS